METLRSWLRGNHYDDVADLIDEILKEWAAKGVKTRRNWWLILAGGRGGKPLNIAGRAFPVLRSAQIRMGRNVTPNATSRGEAESPLPICRTGRWIP